MPSEDDKSLDLCHIAWENNGINAMKTKKKPTTGIW